MKNWIDKTNRTKRKDRNTSRECLYTTDYQWRWRTYTAKDTQEVKVPEHKQRMGQVQMLGYKRIEIQQENEPNTTDELINKIKQDLVSKVSSNHEVHN